MLAEACHVLPHWKEMVCMSSLLCISSRNDMHAFPVLMRIHYESFISRHSEYSASRIFIHIHEDYTPCSGIRWNILWHALWIQVVYLKMISRSAERPIALCIRENPIVPDEKSQWQCDAMRSLRSSKSSTRLSMKTWLVVWLPFSIFPYSGVETHG